MGLGHSLRLSLVSLPQFRSAGQKLWINQLVPETSVANKGLKLTGSSRKEINSQLPGSREGIDGAGAMSGRAGWEGAQRECQRCGNTAGSSRLRSRGTPTTGRRVVSLRFKQLRSELESPLQVMRQGRPQSFALDLLSTPGREAAQA